MTPQPEVSPGGGGGGSSMKSNVAPAEVIPFPIVRRVAFLDRTAEIAASYRDPDRYLASVVSKQADAMRRRGFPDDVIQSEIAALDRAIMSRLAVLA